jgi:CubicO group peptidase (beta-lactamase class C family)
MNLQSAVQALLQDFIDRDIEQGLQVAAYYQGEQVVDAWAGLADPANGRGVDGETLFVVYSASKGVTATAAHLLAERGELDYDAPIAHYWPEFAQGGKDRITLRHVLTHTAAVPHLPDGADLALLCDWEAVCRGLAQLAPLWTPGATIVYHAFTYGWLVGEVVRRVTGIPFARFVQEAICAPLGIDSLFFGISDAVESRVATEEGAPELDVAPADPLGCRIVPPTVRLVSLANEPAFRRASMPAANGIMNARALARHYAALIGEVDGVRLLAPETIAYAGRIHQEGLDIGGEYTRFALGYHSGRPGGSLGSRAAVFGHGGFGGTLAFADPEYTMTFALTKNRAVNPPTLEEGVAYQASNLIRRALRIPDG